MEFIRLGKTDLLVSRAAFDTEALLRAVQEGVLSAERFAELFADAYEGGINFFYVFVPQDFSGACKSLNFFLNDIRKSVKLAFSSAAKTPQALQNDVQGALTFLQTDYFDLFEICDPGFVPVQDSALYESLKKMQADGKFLHIGFFSNDLARIKEAILCGLYETVRFPFNFLSPDESFSCTELCTEHGTGFIADKPLAGGRIENIPLASGFFRCSENVVPLWKIQSEEQLQQILYFEKKPPDIDEQFLKDLEEAKKKLSEK